ncbi:hypothetical protein HS5_24680 [Acidianus sp. HS-5]|nr:hypothetical protein HS5_24680 [Acidianus sp. HS-5]
MYCQTPKVSIDMEDKYLTARKEKRKEIGATTVLIRRLNNPILTKPGDFLDLSILITKEVFLYLFKDFLFRIV